MIVKSTTSPAMTSWSFAILTSNGSETCSPASKNGSAFTV